MSVLPAAPRVIPGEAGEVAPGHANLAGWDLYCDLHWWTSSVAETREGERPSAQVSAEEKGAPEGTRDGVGWREALETS